MAILDVGTMEVAVEWDGRVAIYGLDGALHHTLDTQNVDHGLFLADGRLVIFAREDAWVVREGRVERTIHTGARASLPEQLPDGLVFDGGGDRPTWIDVDTGEVAFLEVDIGVQMRPSGDMITRFGFRAHGGDVVYAPDLPSAADCRFVPGDARAWCASRAADTCEILGFTIDGRLAGRLPGCEIEAVGPRSLVVRDGGQRVWLSLDGGSAGTVPPRGDELTLGPAAVAWRDRDVFVDAGKGPVRLEPPPPPPLPAGLVVSAGGRLLLLGADGRLIDELAGLPAPEPGAKRASVTSRRDLVTVTVDKKVVLELPAKENRSCGQGTDVLATRDTKGVITAWDLLTGAKRWSTRADPTVLSCGVTADLVTFGVEGGSRVLDAATGRVITTTGDIRRGVDGSLLVARRDGKATLLDRQGRSYGVLDGDVRPGRLVGDTAVAWIGRRGRQDVVGYGPEGLRWERISTLEPAFLDGRIYLAVDQSLLAIDPKDGHTIWTYELPARASSLKVPGGG